MVKVETSLSATQAVIMSGMAEGGDPVSFRPLLEAKTEECRRLSAMVEALRARVAELEHLVDTDTLTPLPNRRRFIREVARVVEERGRHRLRAWVMFVDVDGLKVINDTRGHAVGDAALIHVATILRAMVRSFDIVARIGGDEFGLLLERIDRGAVQDKAAQLIEAVRSEPLRLTGGALLPLSISVGLAELRPSDDVEALIARADRAMYQGRAQLRSAR